MVESASDTRTGDEQRRPARRRSRARRSWRRFVALNEVTHRWLSLVLGVLLVIVTTSGALLLYRPEVEGWLHSSIYQVTPSVRPITADQAAGIVAAAHPDDRVTGLTKDLYQAYEVSTAGSEHAYVVDPGTGRITGTAEPTPFLAFLENLHDCALSCEGYPGYIAALDDPVPGLGELTWSSLLLGVLALLLVYLCVTGLVLWWPGVRRFAASFVVRFRRGGYRRDRDLHKVVGTVTVLFLLLWGLTGAYYEFPFVAKWAYALQGQDAPDTTGVTSPAVGSTITLEQAQRAALAQFDQGEVVGHQLPDPEDPTSAYSIYVRSGTSQWAYYQSTSLNFVVAVDRTDAGRVAITAGTKDFSPAALLFGPLGWGDALHRGSPLDPWLRLPFLVAGLMPLLLMWTGVSTWWIRWRLSRRPARAT